MYYNKLSFQGLLDCYDNDFENNHAWTSLKYNAEKLQEILNRTM